MALLSHVGDDPAGRPAVTVDMQDGALAGRHNCLLGCLSSSRSLASGLLVPCGSSTDYFWLCGGTAQLVCGAFAAPLRFWVFGGGPPYSFGVKGALGGHGGHRSRLEELGAVPYGLTTCPPISHSQATTIPSRGGVGEPGGRNPPHPTTLLNPWIKPQTQTTQRNVMTILQGTQFEPRCPSTATCRCALLPRVHRRRRLAPRRWLPHYMHCLSAVRSILRRLGSSEPRCSLASSRAGSPRSQRPPIQLL